MKMKIEWHEECLSNIRASLDRLRGWIKADQTRADAMELDCLSLEAQIERAKRDGRTHFDRDRYNKRRSK